MLTPQTTAVLSAIAQIGLILLMLLIGLEFPFDRLAPGRARVELRRGGRDRRSVRVELRAGGMALPDRARRGARARLPALLRDGRFDHGDPHHGPDPDPHAADAHAHGPDLDHRGGDRRRPRLDPARRGRVDGHARAGRTSATLAMSFAGVTRPRRVVLGARALRALAARGPAHAGRGAAAGLARGGSRRSSSSRRRRPTRSASSRSSGASSAGSPAPSTRTCAKAIRDSIGDLVSVLFLPDLLRLLGAAHRHRVARLGSAALARARPP